MPLLPIPTAWINNKAGHVAFLRSSIQRIWFYSLGMAMWNDEHRARFEQEVLDKVASYYG